MRVETISGGRPMQRSLGRNAGLWLAAGLALVAALPVRAAEPTVAERYLKAAKLRWPAVMVAMKNPLVTPHWVGTTNRFWYRRETAKGFEFVVVDAATGSRSPAFDAKAVSASLAALLKGPAPPENLPFTTIALETDGAIAFEAKADRFRCAADGACVRLGAAPTPDLVVSPDKRTAVFMRAGKLSLRDLATSAERSLADDGTAEVGWGLQPPPGDFHAIAQGDKSFPAPFWTAWSPDSRVVIAARVDLSGSQPYPYIDYAPADGSLRPRALSARLSLVGEPPARIELYAFDLAAGTRRRLDLPCDRLEMRDVGAKRLAWSADGRHAYLFVTAADQGSASLFDMDTRSGKVREVINEAARYPALLAPGGYDSAATAVLDRRGEAVWFSQRDGWPHLYLYDLRTGRLKSRITKGPWVVRGLVRVNEALGRLYFTASGREPGNPYHRSLYSIGLDGKGLARLTPEADDKPMVDPDGRPGFDGAPPFQPVSADGRYVAYTVAPLAAPSTAVVRRTDGTGPAIVFERADASALFAAGFRAPEPFVAKAADGRSDVYGVIYRPSDYDPKKRYPVLDAQYNSPLVPIVPHTLAGASTNVIEAAPPAADAELGLIVVMMDARGTPYRGAAFSNPAPGYLADMGLVDHVAVIRSLAAKDPSMDLGRVGITGASFGGWTSVRALIAHNDLFKVAVAWAPPGAFYNMYDGAGLTAANGVATYTGGVPLRPKPSDKPLNWALIDSIAQVGQLRGKLLLGSGALDENVLPGSTMQFMDAAARANRNVEQIFLPETNHGPLTYLDYVTRRIWDFLTLNLRSETPPVEFAFPAPPKPGDGR